MELILRKFCGFLWKNENVGQGAIGYKSWVIRFWDTGWHNELKTIKLNLT